MWYPLICFTPVSRSTLQYWRQKEICLNFWNSCRKLTFALPIYITKCVGYSRKLSKSLVNHFLSTETQGRINTISVWGKSDTLGGEKTSLTFGFIFFLHHASCNKAVCFPATECYPTKILSKLKCNR